MSKKPEETEYSIKPIELRLVETLQQTYFQNLSNVLSFIAIERLAYNVTENTRFMIEGDKIYVKEEVKEEEVKTK